MSSSNEATELKPTIILGPDERTPELIFIPVVDPVVGVINFAFVIPASNEATLYEMLRQCSVRSARLAASFPRDSSEYTQAKTLNKQANLLRRNEALQQLLLKISFADYVYEAASDDPVILAQEKPLPQFHLLMFTEVPGKHLDCAALAQEIRTGFGIDLADKMSKTTSFGEIAPLALKATFRMTNLRKLREFREQIKYLDSLFGCRDGYLSAGNVKTGGEVDLLVSRDYRL